MKKETLNKANEIAQNLHWIESTLNKFQVPDEILENTELSSIWSGHIELRLPGNGRRYEISLTDNFLPNCRDEIRKEIKSCIVDGIVGALDLVRRRCEKERKRLEKELSELTDQ